MVGSHTDDCGAVAVGDTPAEVKLAAGANGPDWAVSAWDGGGLGARFRRHLYMALRRAAT